MARKKSWLRQRLNSRYVVWKAMRGIGRVAPGASRALGFPMRSVLARDLATAILEDRSNRLCEEASPEELRTVVEPALAYDTLRAGRAPITDPTCTIAHRQAATLERCSLLGHSFTLVDAAGDAVSPWPWTPNWNFARPALLRRQAASDALHLPLMGSAHYYHAYANDILPLWDYLERLHPRGEPLVVVARPDRHPAQAASRQAVSSAFTEVTFREVGPGERLDIPRVRWLFQLCDNQEWIPVPGDAIRRFAAAVRKVHGLPGTSATSEKLFVSRGGTRIRRMTDEPAIAAHLSAMGFSGFVPQAGDHRAQVERFGAARVIVAVHGAALTNLLFASPGAQVVEIFPSNFVKSTYWWLSRRLGLGYHPVIGGPGDYDQVFAAGEEGVMAAVRRALANAGTAP